MAAAAAVALAALAGCNSSEPSAPPTSEPALTTATAEPDVVATSEPVVTTEKPTEEPTEAPVAPAEAQEMTEDGAEAFVLHYLDTLNKARDSGVTESLASLASDACRSCANFEESASSGALPSLEYDVETAVVFVASATVPAFVDDRGATGRLYFELVWDDGWLVESVKVEP